MKAIRNMIAVAALLASSSAFAQYTDGVVKIAVLSDMSSLYSDIGGPGSGAAAKLAIAHFNPPPHGMKGGLVNGHQQNKAGGGSGLANSWYDRDGVDMIIDVPNS